MAGRHTEDFVNNKYLIQNLNETTKIKDTSWIQPGITTWDWRARGAKEGGFSYALNTETLLRFIENTAKMGIPYFTIDANWYGPEHEKTSDPTTAAAAIDMEKVTQYAREKNVGIWLYVNRVAFQKLRPG